MRVPTSCRSMTSTSSLAQHLRRRLARLAVERIDRHPPRDRRGRAPVSIMFSCTSERNPCWGPKIAQRRARGGPPGGRRCARARDRPTPGCRRRRRACRRARKRPAAARSRVERPCAIISCMGLRPGGSKPRKSFGRPGSLPRLGSPSPAGPCLYDRRLIDYAPLVASPACFARAESRSSLNPDSFSPPRLCRADEQPPSGTVDPE